MWFYISSNKTIKCVLLVIKGFDVKHSEGGHGRFDYAFIPWPHNHESQCCTRENADIWSIVGT